MKESNVLVARLIGALRLDAAVYEEIEADRDATGQAAFVVVATSLASGAANAALGGPGVGFVGTIASLIGWALYAWVAYAVGVKLFPGPQTKSNWGELARTLGFANTPRIFILLAVLPGAAALVRALVAIWVLVATVVALRAALDISTARAIGVAIASALAQLVVIAVALSFFS